MTSLSRQDWILLTVLTLSGGFNWTVMKFGVQNFPPITFRALGMAGAIPILWLAARMQDAPLTLPTAYIRPLPTGTF